MPQEVFIGTVDDPITFNSSLWSSAIQTPPTAELSFDLSHGKEDGNIFITSTEEAFDITRKNEASSWKMSSSPTDWAPLVAFKEQWWRRYFEITEQGRRYIMTPDKSCSSDFVVRCVDIEVEVHGGKIPGEVIGELRLISKREWKYEVKFGEAVGKKLPAFCFWLVTLMNRRQFVRDIFDWQIGHAVNSSFAVLFWRRLRNVASKKEQSVRSADSLPHSCAMRLNTRNVSHPTS